MLILDKNIEISQGFTEKSNKAVEIQVSIGYTEYEEWENYKDIGLKVGNL